MLLADLKAMAGGMGIKGAGSMKKAALVDAIKAAQAGQGSLPEAPAEQKSEQKSEQSGGQRDGQKDGQPGGSEDKGERQGRQRQRNRDDRQRDGQKDGQPDQKQADQKQADQKQADQGKADQGKGGQKQGDQQKSGDQKQGDQKQGQGKQGGQGGQQKAQPKQDDGNRDNRDNRDNRADDDHDDDGEGGSRRNRRRRGRDRDRASRGREPDTEVREDDVLVPAAGILDVLDNYAFVRTSGYLAGADDVYLSLSMVRKYGLRRGDAVVGQVRQPREGERREKFNPMVRIDTVNGVDPEQAKNRVEFEKLTPVSPTERLRLETGPDAVTGRVIDLVTPVGKGQRGLVLAPSDAGKTATVQAVANAITTNNPECHLMVVLIDERPEEVTDFQRAVRGEVVASTFDRPASDHTTLAELAVERAKRLVELGHDVVVLIDGLTRLGRAFNLTAPASGRILPGGVDAAALYPPKRLFGAARKIDNGGSLTILATALTNGSVVDDAVLDELTGTDNLRLHLSRELADRGLAPAVDVHASGTRREDLLLTKEEQAVRAKLRAELAGKDGAEALEQLLGMVRNSKSNDELLLRLSR
ncbi:transcription termination factor Rho [Nocardioides sp. J54]|uniref:transcription termination factor Rho n=1 Tax=Nocardioides sp. J54 TaxID=935866 RepID=UPI000A04F873